MATDLTSLSAVRAFLQKDAADTDQDTIISAFITAASKAMMRHAEREFVTTTSGSTARTFEYAGGGFLSLAPYDAQTVTAIRMDTDLSSPTTLTTDDYRLWPYPAKDGVYTGIRLAPYVLHTAARWQQRLVEVTGTWGFPSVPEDVAQWCKVTVAIWLRRDVSGFSTNFNIDEDRLEHPEQLPSAVRAGLASYRRQTYA